MKKTIFTVIFILSFCLVTIGQDSNCPTISVTGPPGVLQPDETATFTVSIIGEIEESKLEYIWSVDKGKIIEGQGTRVITVGEIPWDSTPTATVEVKGLPEACPNTASETGVICSCVYPILIDEFEISSKPIDSKRLDAYISELENNPIDKGYIIIYSNKNFPLLEIKKIESFVKNYLITEKITDDRIEIIIDRGSENDTENRIRFWRVPQGADPPIP